jgi:hypothetical protein
MTIPIPIAAPDSSAIETVCEKPLSSDDWAALAIAVELLEKTSLAARLTQILGRQVKLATSFIPQQLTGTVSRAVTVALRVAMKTAIRSLGTTSPRKPSSPLSHRAMAVASGAAGGALGFATLPIELPISTTLMLRAIADVARSQGEDLSSPETALACMEVFALGGGGPGDEAWESGYFAVRGVLAKTVSEATRYMLHRGVVEEGAPALLRFVSLIAARFGAVVTQKVIAQTIPVVGAVSGGAINYAFMEHFQNVARGHFTVRRLERECGPKTVREAYEQIRLGRAGDRAKTL